LDYQHKTAGGGPIVTLTETEDTLLGGRVRLIQPAAGYRVAIDPILLAAAVHAAPGERVLDAGCGTGAAALCLAARVPDAAIVGVEIAPELAALAWRSVQLNGFEKRVEIAEASLATYAAAHRGAFDQVMTNPPFYEQGRHTRSPQLTRAAAHGEETLSLAGWIKAAEAALRPGGRLTLIHRADRLPEILAAMERRFGAAAIFPFWPRVGEPASRVLVSAIKGRRTPLRLLPGLILHRADGSYTEEAERILRHAAALDPGLPSA
jgi:tRNA1(Val) A37 N6-methylase TrmN6